MRLEISASDRDDLHVEAHFHPEGWIVIKLASALAVAATILPGEEVRLVIVPVTRQLLLCGRMR